jgi:hypothetical protein
MMLALYLAGGSYPAEACAWLHEDDTEADTLDLLECALNAYSGGVFDAKATVEYIARGIGYPLTLAEGEAGHE